MFYEHRGEIERANLFSSLILTCRCHSTTIYIYHIFSIYRRDLLNLLGIQVEIDILKSYKNDSHFYVPTDEIERATFQAFIGIIPILCIYKVGFSKKQGGGIIFAGNPWIYEY